MRSRFRRFWPVLTMIVLTALYLAPRLAGLDLFVTTDEPRWLGRSANFYRALRAGEFADTYQYAHPGVTTMWAGSLAYLIALPDYATHVTQNLGNVFSIDLELRDLDADPMHILIVARICKIAVQAVFFGIAMFFVRRLFGMPVMIVSGLMIALDPFLIGHDSLLHVDGMFAITGFCAALAIAWAVASGNRTMAPWMIAGALAAFAWLSRSTGLVLIVPIGLVIAVQVVRRWRSGRDLRDAMQVPVFSGTLWFGAATITTVLLFPALWVDPATTMAAMFRWSSTAATDGHELPTFFRGTVFPGDPGPLFYPLVVIWRMTPVAMLGIAAAVIVLFVPALRQRLADGAIRSAAIVGTFGLVYGLGMSFGAKKFDRYVLPLYPIIDLAAAVGLVTLGAALIAVLARRPAVPRRALRLLAPVAASAILAVQAQTLIAVEPYPLGYYNPLLGGPTVAEDQLQMGWGEGADQVAAWLQARAEEDGEVTLIATSAGAVLRYVFTDNIEVSNAGFDTPADWYEADYFLASIQQWQRGLSPAYAFLENTTPVAEFRVSGVVAFRLYEPQDIAPPRSLFRTTGCSSLFDGTLELVQVREGRRQVGLYWRRLDGERGGPYAVSIRFVPVAGSGSGPREPDLETLFIPADGRLAQTAFAWPWLGIFRTRDDYFLEINVRDFSTGQRMMVTQWNDPVPSTSAFVHTDCYDVEPTAVPGPTMLPR